MRRWDIGGRRIKISKFPGNRALAVMHDVLTHPGIASLALPSLRQAAKRAEKKFYYVFS
jgi:hypothetical protein